MTRLFEFDLTALSQILYFTIWLNTMTATATDNLSRVFGALADPTRRAILSRLSSGEAGVQELAKPFSMTLPAISKHLKVLERARLIRRGKDKQWRPCALEATPMKAASDWIGDYRQFWDESFERLDEYLKEIQLQDKKSNEGEHHGK